MSNYPTPSDLGVEVLDHEELASERREAGRLFENACTAAYRAERTHGVLSVESDYAHAICLLARDRFKSALRKELRAFGRLLP